MFPSVLRLRLRFASQIAAFMLFFLTVALHAQAADEGITDLPARRVSIPAKVLIGMPGIEPNSFGDLSFSEKFIEFSSEGSTTRLPKANVLSVSQGDEQVELGGVAGKFARAAIPYGGGLALGAVAHKKVGMLTIEFSDASGQYHGAVFVLKTRDMAAALVGLNVHSSKMEAPRLVSALSCPTQVTKTNTVQVRMVAADTASGFPSEDRVLLYEHLIEKLQSQKTVEAVYRAGDTSAEAQCAEFVVTVSPMDFDKGNQAVRASVGPLGHFVGTTRLSFHLTITARDGASLLDEDFRKSEGADSDSLNITKVVSKTVIKNLKQSRAHLRKTQKVEQA